MRGYEVLSEFTGTYSLHIITVCILFAMMLGNRIRSPMLGFLSATWPNGLFAPAASQTNRCTSNLGVVVIGDILSSMTWLLPGGGKIKPHQCMAEISKWKELFYTAIICYYANFMLQTLQSIEALLCTKPQN